jgi:osmotically-inducible protein OsmY
MVNELVPHDKRSTLNSANQTQSIRKHVKCLAWALSAGLAAAGPCWGGTSPGQNQNQPSDSRQVVTVTAAMAHEWETQVELALLADPLTFPYSVKPQISNNGMELRGQVPNVWIRDHAMKVVKGMSQVAVVDAMTVNPKMAVALPRMQSATFAMEARQRLERAAVKLSNPVEITAPGSGQIVLAGQVDSADDKLKMSRALRGLNGCTCVKNDLAVVTPAAPVVEKVKQAVAVEPAKKAAVVKDASKVESAKQSTMVKDPAKVEPVKSSTSDIVRRMPAGPVTPMKGTLQKEAGAAAGVPAMITFDDEPKPSPIAQTKHTEATSVATKEEEEPKQAKTVASEPPAPTMEEKPAAPKQEPAKAAESSSAALPSQQFQDALQKKLKTVLNHSAKEVHVQFDTAGAAKIRVKVAKITEIERVHGLLMQMPELAGYDVKVEFVVAQ